MTQQQPWSRRDVLRRALAAGTTIAAGPALLGACSRTNIGATIDPGETLRRIKDEGTIRVGFANEAPYGYKDTSGNLVGEAPAVAEKVLARMGIEHLDGKLTGFGSLIPALQAGAVDMIAAGMFITPERCGEILFSEPDYCGTTSFLVPEGNPDGITTYADAAATGIRLGVLNGAIEIGYAEAAGVSDMVTFNDAASGFEGLEAGRVDAFTLTSISLRFLLDNREGVPLEVTEPFVPEVDGQPQEGCGGYGFRMQDSELVDEFNVHLLEMKESGELLETMEEYGFTEEELADKTTQQLCSA